MASQTEDRHAVRALPGPVLLIGANGMLGRAWRRLLSAGGVAYEAPGRPLLDLADPGQIDAWATDRYPTVVNCAAWTDVDGAEADEAGAMAINAVAPERLARACRRAGSMLVHYSTDYVFDGAGARPYREDDPVSPRSAYGRTKAAGEAAIRAEGCRHLIVRTSWLYAPWGRNFVLTMLGLLSERPEVLVVDDQRGRPTSAPCLADTTARLVGAGATGTYHAADGGECTWCELAIEIASRARLGGTVTPCTTAQFPRPAPRPAYSVLDLTRTEAMVGPMQPWQQNLQRTIDAWKRPPAHAPARDAA